MTNQSPNIRDQATPLTQGNWHLKEIFGSPSCPRMLSVAHRSSAEFYRTSDSYEVTWNRIICCDLSSIRCPVFSSFCLECSILCLFFSQSAHFLGVSIIRGPLCAILTSHTMQSIFGFAGCYCTAGCPVMGRASVSRWISCHGGPEEVGGWGLDRLDGTFSS